MVERATLELGLFTLVALAALAMSGLVLAAGPRRSVNRTLALFLALLCCNYALDGWLRRAPSDLVSLNAALHTATTWHWAALAYLLFLGIALDTPFARPLRTMPARVVLALLAALNLLAFTWIFARDEGLRRLPDGTWQLSADTAPLAYTIGSSLAAAAFAYGLVASLHALARAPRGSTARARAGAYALAFGVQDAGLAITGALDTAGSLDGWVYPVAYAAPLLLALPLLVAALLRHQLFDFDLKVKWTIRRGTLVGLFVAAFFVVASIAEQWLQQRFGLLVGGLAVGLMLFALRPLERAADRVADAAMPRVQDTPEYRLVRKREVYRAAVESAWEDGGVTDKERGMLATLAAQLGLDPREAYEIEREARAPSG